MHSWHIVADWGGAKYDAMDPQDSEHSLEQWLTEQAARAETS
jgi:hypothetical protein